MEGKLVNTYKIIIKEWAGKSFNIIGEATLSAPSKNSAIPKADAYCKRNFQSMDLLAVNFVANKKDTIQAVVRKKNG